MTRIRILLIATTALAGMPVLAQSGAPVDQGPKQRPDIAPAFETQTRAPAIATETPLAVTEIATGLEHPWGIAVLPGAQGYLVTERSGALRHIARDGTVSDPIEGVPDVLNEEQGGLLDVALGPDFETTRRVYFTYADPVAAEQSATAAGYGVLSEDMTRLEAVTQIFRQTPGSPSPMHYGSRILFDGDGHAYITTGEHFTLDQRVLAQDLDTTYGKVVRVGLDGGVPSDNPFSGRDDALDILWSLGHRNPQGAAIRPGTGELWVVEHGPRGGDELNLVEPGNNYGWPTVSYGINYDGSEVGSGEAAHEANGFTEPRYYWDPVIAPGGMTFYEGDMFPEWDGDLLIGALVAGGLVRIGLDGTTVAGEERLLSDLGRTRDVAVDSDGSVLLVTDFPDGALIRVTPDGRETN
jgi:glucose/arabinose dehydrogenase